MRSFGSSSYCFSRVMSRLRMGRTRVNEFTSPLRSHDLDAHRLSGPNKTCDTMLARFGSISCVILKPKEIDMANRQQRGNREVKKPKKEKIKVIAAAPSQKATAWQPTLASGKKK